MALIGANVWLRPMEEIRCFIIGITAFTIFSIIVLHPSIQSIEVSTGICNDSNYVSKILDQCKGAVRQLKVFDEHKNLVSVVDYCIEQFLYGAL